MSIGFKLLIPLTLAFSFAIANGSTSTRGDEDYSELLGPVRTQGNIGWCYANAAADLISYQYRNEWRGFQASATWIAFHYNLSENREKPGTFIFREGGDIEDAIRYAAAYKYSCPRQLDTILMENGMDIPLKQKLYSLEELQKKYKDRNASLQSMQDYEGYLNIRLDLKSIIGLMPRPQLEAALDLPINQSAIAIANATCEEFKQYFPMNIAVSSTNPDVKQILNRKADYYDENLKDWIRYEADKNGWFRFDRPTRTLIPAKPLDLIERINEQIDNKNVVGIGYYFDLISHNPDDKDGHASVIVGRRFRNGSWQFKIRNSWGPGCTVGAGATKKKIYGPKVVECEESGHVWVTAKDLNASLDSITYFKNPPR